MLWVQYIIVLICVAAAAVYLMRTFARSATTSCASKGCGQATRNTQTELKRTPLVQIGQPTTDTSPRAANPNDSFTKPS